MTFFLKPGEELSNEGIKKMIVLADDEAVLLKAIDKYECKVTKKSYKPGQTWMIQGPLDFIPPIQIKVVEIRKAIPLAENDGVYVRNFRSGEVRLIKGPQTYLLSSNEYLWAKPIDILVEELLTKTAYCPPKVDAKGNYIYERK